MTHAIIEASTTRKERSMTGPTYRVEEMTCAHASRP